MHRAIGGGGGAHGRLRLNGGGKAETECGDGELHRDGIELRTADLNVTTVSIAGFSSE